jgi:tetratricopeptide (TPR) repeat protein
VEVHRLLNEEKYADLARLVESKTSLANKDTRNESELGRVMDAFYIADPAMAALFDRWAAADPRSFAQYLARAVQSYALAYLEPGTDVAAKTSDAQVAGMLRHLERVVEDATVALDINSQLTEAYKVLIEVARMEGDQRHCGLFAARGLEIAPASFRVRAALVSCRLPRWGGSHDQVREIARLARPFFSENPDLYALNGFVAWDQGRIAEGEQALTCFDEALKAGPYWRFYFERAREYFRADQFDRALADSTEALRLNPQEPDVLLLHVEALAGLGRLRGISTTRHPERDRRGESRPTSLPEERGGQLDLQGVPHAAAGRSRRGRQAADTGYPNLGRHRRIVLWARARTAQGRPQPGYPKPAVR